jgi:hypothetical protein
LDTFDSVRRQVKDSVIIFVDSSIGGLDKYKEVISLHVNCFLDCSEDKTAQDLNQKMLKSLGETYLLMRGLDYVRHNFDLNQKGRVFKLGGRCELSPEFTMDDYEDTEGKYVFKKRLDSWMHESIQKEYGSTHILETRMYSWSLGMSNDYHDILTRNVELLCKGFDTEHAHFLNIPKDKLLEFDMLNVGCFSVGLNRYMND